MSATPVSSTTKFIEASVPKAAVAYARSGLRVLPLEARGKRPLGALVPRGFKDASSDPSVVAAWFQRQPFANVGICTGDGFVVIDVDERNGGERDPSWPETLTAKTPGGWHLYYSVTDDLPTRVQGIAPGVDLKATGGYCVAAPSRKLGGKGWAWANDLPIAAAPDIVYAPQGEPGRQSSGSGEYGEPFEPLDHIPAGARHSELTRWGGWLRSQGFDAGEILETLEAVNVAHCAEPLPPKEVQSIARWAGRLES